MSVIRTLPDTIINQIAAGEVVERPAAVVKELIENALDAGAGRISVLAREGGRAAIRVDDDGGGMAPDDLKRSIERHATSKIPDFDLTAIATCGFRGEALASIAAVARLTIASRHRDEDTGWEIAIEGGGEPAVRPAARTSGTCVTVRDLFFATPARLKFLKGERGETAAIKETVHALALANPAVTFSLSLNDRPATTFPAHAGDDRWTRRMQDVLGPAFIENSIPIEITRNGYRLHGRIGLPTAAKSTARNQSFFVNGRPIKDRSLAGALKGAYADVLSRDRHPAACLFITVPVREVDVNVHPAKTEVRFSESQMVRGLIVGTIKRALEAESPRTATTLAEDLIASAPIQGSFRLGAPSTGTEAEMAALFGLPQQASDDTKASTGMASPEPHDTASLESPAADESKARHETTALPVSGASPPQAPSWPPHPVSPGCLDERDLPLGKPFGQAHGLFILSETRDGIVVVDQHAAHERILYERMKSQAQRDGIPSQRLLAPMKVSLSVADTAVLESHFTSLRQLGLHLTSDGVETVTVHAMPAALVGTDYEAFVTDLAERLAEDPDSDPVRRRLDDMCGTLACHRAVKSGDAMSLREMSSLLRMMEATPNASQCNHGRPTFVKMPLPRLYSLFGR